MVQGVKKERRIPICDKDLEMAVPFQFQQPWVGDHWLVFQVGDHGRYVFFKGCEALSGSVRVQDGKAGAGHGQEDGTGDQGAEDGELQMEFFEHGLKHGLPPVDIRSRGLSSG